MMFSRVNKQPGMQKFYAVTIKKSMTEYHQWINGLLTIYSNTVVYGEKLVWWIWSLVTLLKHLMMLLKYNFLSGLHVYTLPKT